MNKEVSLFAIEEVPNLLLADVWTRYDFYFSEKDFRVDQNNKTILHVKDERLTMVYWFSIAAEKGWVTSFRFYRVFIHVQLEQYIFSYKKNPKFK